MSNASFTTVDAATAYLVAAIAKGLQAYILPTDSKGFEVRICA